MEILTAILFWIVLFIISDLLCKMLPSTISDRRGLAVALSILFIIITVIIYDRIRDRIAYKKAVRDNEKYKSQ